MVFGSYFRFIGNRGRERKSGSIKSSVDGEIVYVEGVCKLGVEGWGYKIGLGFEREV